MKKVFLSGPIRGIAREDALSWRNKTVALLPNFEVFHALRNRETIETLPDPRLAVVRDKKDIDNSDIILVNDTFADASMIGTSMEILYAYEKNKVVIIFGDAHQKDYWLNYHSHVRVNNLQEACLLINTFFN